MRLRFLVTITILFCLLATAQGQYIPDEEFDWVYEKDHSEYSDRLPVYGRVEVDPILYHQNFKGLLEDLIDAMDLEQNVNGVVKIRVLFNIDKPLYVTKIGTKGFAFSQISVQKLALSLNAISKIKPGQQRGQDANSRGFIYVYVESGKVQRVRFVNFQVSS